MPACSRPGSPAAATAARLHPLGRRRPPPTPRRRTTCAAPLRRQWAHRDLSLFSPYISLVAAHTYAHTHTRTHPVPCRSLHAAAAQPAGPQPENFGLKPAADVLGKPISPQRHNRRAPPARQRPRAPGEGRVLLSCDQLVPYCACSPPHCDRGRVFHRQHTRTLSRWPTGGLFPHSPLLPHRFFFFRSPLSLSTTAAREHSKRRRLRLRPSPPSPSAT